jgi:hypothetical protein
MGGKGGATMEQKQPKPEVYDFRQQDRIWQRVAPGLEPYPAARAEMETDQERAVIATAVRQESRNGLRIREESRLPGAIPDPCCMGSGAAELLEVLTGFIEEELEDQRAYQTMLRQAPSWARQRIRELAVEEGDHARRLMAVYYLITGECYRPAIPTSRMCMERWCVALRERYHEAACNGLNYARTADETTDLCLSRLLQELSGEEYRHADLVLGLLQRSLRG